MRYSQVSLEADYMKAAFDYVAYTYGLQVAYAFPLAVKTVWYCILAGCPEATAKETLLAHYGLVPL